LEPKAGKLGGGIRNDLARTSDLSEERIIRLNYFMRIRRNELMKRNVQHNKPKLVIAASSHVIYLEGMNPRKVIWHHRMSEAQKHGYRLQLLDLEQRYSAVKKARKARAEARERRAKKTRPRKPKP